MSVFLFRIVPKVTQNANVGRVFAEIEAAVVDGLAREDYEPQFLRGILITPIIIDPGLAGEFKDVISFKRGSASVVAGRNIDFYGWRFSPREEREAMAKKNIMDTLKAVPARYLTSDFSSLLIKLVADSKCS